MTGRNGSGKSNAINMAYACLTNDFGRNSGTKADNIRSTMRGADAESKIITTWEHLGQEFTIERDLLKDTHKMMRQGKKQLDRSGEIQKAVEDILQTSFEVIGEHVFIPQWAMFEWLIASPTKRSISYARICDTERAEKAHAVLGKEIANLSATVPAVLPDSKRTAIELKDAKKRYVAARQLVDSIRERLLESDRAQKYQRAVERYKLKKAAAAQIAELMPSIEAANTLANYKTLQLADLQQKLKHVSSDIAAADAWYEYEQSEARRRALEAKLAALKPPTAPENYDQEAAISKLLTTMEIQLEGAKAILDTFADKKTAKCPTCGTDGDVLIAQIADAQKLANTLPAKIAEYNEFFEACGEYSFKLHAYQKDESRIQGELAAYKPLPKPETPVPDKARNALASEQAAIRQQISRTQAELEQATRNHLSLKARFDNATKAQESDMTEETYNKVVKKLAAHEKAKEEVVDAEVASKTLEVEVRALEKRYAEECRIVERSAGVIAAVNHLSNIRSVLHRDSLPKLVHDGTHESLAVEINQNLSDFERPFRVIPDSQLGFRAVFRDGNEQPVERLSGGQLVVTAMTGRLGFNSLFAADLGMMVADEPTAGLDSQNILHLQELLQRMSQHVKDRGHQVIVITHEVSLMNSFDQILCVS